MSTASSPGTRGDSQTELIMDVDLTSEADGTVGQEGGVIFSRDSEAEGSVRYRTSSAGTTGATSESPLGFEEEFIDVPGQSQDPIATALEQCEKYVLFPYRSLLKILGWTQFTKDGDSTLLKSLRVVLVLFWVIVIITTFITQILSCFRRDSFLPTMMLNNTRTVQCKDHLISSYILPDLLLLASYLFGLYLFSRGETEYLSNLAEKVFVKGVQAKLNYNKQLIITGGIFLLAGLLWIILSFAVRLMTSFALDLWSDTTVIQWDNNTEFGGAEKNTLLALSLIGFVFFDMVYVAAVINYAAQSEMNIYLLTAIRRMIVQKTYTCKEQEIDAAIKDILECRQYLRVLNGKTATATALIMFNLGSAGVLAMVSLNNISNETAAQNLKDLATVAVAFNVVLWIALVSFPFIQAARVSDAAQKLISTGPQIRARPLQYTKTPQIELDSFVSLTRAVRLRAAIFGIPVYPWLVWLMVVGFCFTALILFQTGLYNFTPYL